MEKSYIIKINHKQFLNLASLLILTEKTKGTLIDEDLWSQLVEAEKYFKSEETKK